MSHLFTRGFQRNTRAHTALITGASSGLGADFARQLAPELTTIFLTARRADRLEQLAEEIRRPALRVVVIPGDLTDENFRVTLFNQVAESGTPLSLLINNAGFGTVAAFPSTDRERQLQMISLNIEAPVDLTHRLLHQMEAGSAIVNVCSTAALQPVSYMAVYGATKAFLLSFTLALGAELKKRQILTLALCPGPTVTEFHLAAGLETKIDVLPGMSSPEVVASALAALRRREAIYIPGILNRLLSLAPRLLPLRFGATVTERMLRSYLR